MTRQLLLVAAVSALVGVASHARAQERLQTVVQRAPDAGANAETPTIKLRGTVVDASSKPVAGATVEYWQYAGTAFQPGGMELKKKTTSSADGAFEFQGSRGMGILLAQKPGLAPAWKQFGASFNSATTDDLPLMLTAPGSLAGTVLDQSNQPVANAEVFVGGAFVQNSSATTYAGNSLQLLTGKPAREHFTTRTDAAGHFDIQNFPTNASAILGVQFPGKVLRSDAESTFDWETGGYRTGQPDIKLVVEPAGSVEGKIISEDTNQPPPIARLTLQSDAPGFGRMALWDKFVPPMSGSDGSFQIKDVAAGSYHLQAVFGTNALPDWVAESVHVSVESGQTAGGVQLKPSRGGLLDVAVIGKDDRQPVSGINLSVFKENAQSSATSGNDGMAHFRLAPGTYQVAAFRESRSADQVSAMVEAGTNNRVEVEIAPPKKITGMIRLPDGQPASGILVQMVGGYGPTADVKSGSDGKFSLEWNQQHFAGQMDTTFGILVRDVEHNLAVAQDIDEDTGPLDLKLAPALTLAGHAECDGKPVTNATAALVYWTGRHGQWLQGLARTNVPGQFEIPALPPGRKYGLIVSAPGYGQQQMMNLDISADPGRQELDAAELKPANLTLAGQVLDADDKPVAGCNVNLNGDGQPNAHAHTDHEGRFTFAHVCAGSAQVSANSQQSFGNISAEGGDTNVVLRLGQNYGSNPNSTSHKLKGVITDPTGQPVAGALAVVFPNNGSQWVKTDANGAYHLTWSLQPWQAQSGSPILVIRDPAHGLATTEELSEEITNLDVKLKPSVSVTGQVKGTDDAPLAGAQAGLWFKAGNTYEQLDDQLTTVDPQGRFEIKCLPSEAQYIVYASAKGYGRSQQQVEPDTETNRMELNPFVLKLANHVIAGQVLNENDKPASGINVSLNGSDQPNSNMTTDAKGRFHFQVCEGRISLFANSQGGFAQATAEADDTNIVMTLGSNTGVVRPAPQRASLKGNPLPDLAGLNFTADALPAGQPVLLCLFDVGQRPSRHVLHLLDQQTAALRKTNICVLGLQAAIISDDAFNDWKTAGPVSFPVGRVVEKSEKSKWASSVSTLPWLILADASHRVIAEGFSLEELDAQIQKLPK